MNIDWVIMLNEMIPKSYGDDYKEQWKQLANFIEIESAGTWLLQGYYFASIIQIKDLEWVDFFDILKRSSDFNGIIKLDMPMKDNAYNPRLIDGYVFAKYDPTSDSLQLHLYSGSWSGDYANFDGYGLGDEASEVIEGAINRNKEWLTEPKLQWIQLLHNPSFDTAY